MTVELTPPGQYGIPTAPPGAIMSFAGPMPPGWLDCDGTSYLRADYPELFAALGGTSSPWGLADSTHFNVPDLRGRTVIGEDGATYGLATPVGAATHTLTIAEMPAHGHNRTESTPAGGAVAGRVSTVNTQGTTSSVASANTGGGGAHNNMQPSMPMNYGICTGRVTSLPSALERYQVVTSSTRPTVVYAGLQIYETDTGRTYIHNGTTWKYQHGGTDPIGVRAYRNAAFTLTVSATVPTLIPFDTEVWDYGNNFNTATGVYTCPEATQYMVVARTSASAVSGERFIAEIFKSGAEYIRGVDWTAGGSVRNDFSAAGVVDAAAGDTIDFRVHQLNGTGRGLDVPSNPIDFMTISRA